MKVKKFRDYLLESEDADPFQFVETLDLVEELPDQFGPEARFEDWDPAELEDTWDSYGVDPDEEPEQPDFDTELEVWTLKSSDSQHEERLRALGLAPIPEPTGDEWNLHVDPSWYSEPVKLKLVWSDEEHGYGRYGPYGGGHEVVIWAGIPEKNTGVLLKKFSEIYQANQDWFTTI